MFETAWLPGYFTRRIHCVQVPPNRVFSFRGISIVWALCGTPAAVIDHTDALQHCATCAHLSPIRP
jgi:hypothetical protein